MPKNLFRGDSVWIIPCMIILAIAVFITYTVVPTVEYFRTYDESKKVKKKKKKKRKVIIEDIDEDSDSDEEPSDKLKEKIKKKEPPIVKEEFSTFSNTAEILKPGWRNKPLPKTLEKYNGQIQGYNCGEYTEFMFGTAAQVPTTCPTPTSNPNDYIFPGNPPACAASKASCLSKKCPKYVSEPRILGYEGDVNKKIVEYESMNILPDYKPEDVAHLERPQFMFNRKYGVDDPIISDWNKFEVGQINTRTHKTPQYSVE